MHKGLLPTIALAIALAPVGCGDWLGLRRSPSEQQPPADTHDDGRKLTAQLEALRSKNVVLASRLEEQLDRETQLSSQLSRLKFLSAQQRLHIETLAAAPAQRDKYRKRVEEQATQIAELAHEIDSLKAENDRLKTLIARGRAAAEPRLTTPPTIQPATQPVTAPAD